MEKAAAILVIQLLLLEPPTATKTKVNYFNLVYFLLSNLPFQLAFDPSSSEEEGAKVRACNSGKVLPRVLQFSESLMKYYGSPGLSATSLILLWWHITDLTQNLQNISRVQRWCLQPILTEYVHSGWEGEETERLRNNLSFLSCIFTMYTRHFWTH